MAVGDRVFLTNDQKGSLAKKTYLFFQAEGNLTADATRVGQIPVTGRITNIVLAAQETGADSADPLDVTLTTTVGASTNPASTSPKIDKAAGTGLNSTFASGTGITQAVINTANDNVSAGDQIKVVFDVTRTTPDTEAADVSVMIEISEDQDHDPAV